MHRLIIVIVCILMGSASSADALRCGARIISKGAYKPEVLNKCGEPEFIEEIIFYDTVELQPRSHHRKVYSHSVSVRRGEEPLYYEVPAGHRLVAKPTRAEDWTYNFGPNRLMQRLRFIGGKLHDISTAGYGY